MIFFDLMKNNRKEDEDMIRLYVITVNIFELYDRESRDKVNRKYNKMIDEKYSGKEANDLRITA
jgi:hypothetical protein